MAVPVLRSAMMVKQPAGKVAERAIAHAQLPSCGRIDASGAHPQGALQMLMLLAVSMLDHRHEDPRMLSPARLYILFVVFRGPSGRLCACSCASGAKKAEEGCGSHQ